MTGQRWVVAGCLTLAALAAVSCSSSVPAPQSIALGRATCAKCRSVISGLEAAAQAVFPDGTVRHYDDLGCMATDPAALKGDAQLYVQLAGERGWVRVEDIHFASPAQVRTAQGYNFLAYPEEEARRIDPAGWARGWNDVVAELARRDTPEVRR